MVNKESLESFKVIMKEEYGVKYSDEEAEETSNNLVGYFQLLIDMVKSREKELRELEERYLSVNVFPLTTQKNLEGGSELSLEKQMILDSVNQDQLEELAERGDELSDKQVLIFDELKTKKSMRERYKDLKELLDKIYEDRNET